MFLSLFFLSCKNDFSFSANRYEIELPAVPASWIDILGNPQWRIEWMSSDNTKKIADIQSGQSLSIHIAEEWTTPVIAYPFWSQFDIIPEIMKPAGALFPFDVRGDKIYLSWRGGVDAFFYIELAVNFEKRESGTQRYPHYFNWIRFRELMRSSDINELIQTDPWLADWKYIALRTAQSGFDRRRIVPLNGKDILLPVSHEGYWIGTSPFAEAIFQNASENLSLKIYNNEIETYISGAGILRISDRNTWLLTSFKR